MEYLALDITSESSYSELIEDVEWGYNRDHEQLPQVNLCMMVGETSRLPIHQTVYAGSHKDVRTLVTSCPALRLPPETACHHCHGQRVLQCEKHQFPAWGQ